VLSPDVDGYGPGCLTGAISESSNVRRQASNKLQKQYRSRYYDCARVVLDTAVIVAATRSDAGASRQLVLAALEKRYELLLSVPLVLEYEAVLKGPVQLVVSHGTLQEIDKLLDALIMVLEAALSGLADMLVTFNQRDFEPGTSALGIDVVVPREALKRIKEER
jgi:predicted nucleic acid-binding protein